MEHDFGVGDVLLGKYRIERLLGRGGMGSVYLARHVEMDELVAIKLLNRSLAENAESMARFVREAKAAVRIKSEHVVRVLDVARLESGEPCMVMEFLEGEDLEHRIARQVLAPGELADLMLQVCEPLALAHAQDIVHRDLKPANLFVTQRPDRTPSMKVLDFGISKFAGSATTPSMTSTHGLLGSPLYMSPEQMSSAKNVDARTDLWALGVIMYQALTGAFPFNGDSLPALVLDVMHKTPPPVSSVRGDVPPALEQVIARCLEKDRAARYASVRELALALEPFASALGRTHVPRILAALGARADEGSALGPTIASSASSAPSAPGASSVPGASSAGSPNPRASTAREWASTATEPPRTQSRALVIALSVAALAGVGTSVWALSRSHAPADAAAGLSSAPPTTPSTVPVPGQASLANPGPSASAAAPTPSPSASAATPPTAKRPVPGKPTPTATAVAAVTAETPKPIAAPTPPSTPPPAPPAAKPTSTETVIE